MTDMATLPHPRRMSTKSMVMTGAGVLLGVIVIVAAIEGHNQRQQAQVSSITVNQNTFHGEWPFAPGFGTLACDNAAGQAVTFSADGTTYAVNDAAVARAKGRGWAQVEPIWLASDGSQDNQPGTQRLSLADIVATGLLLCHR